MRSPVLPDYRIVYRFARMPVPDNRRFSLVRYTDCGYLGPVTTSRFLGGEYLGRPDGGRVMLNPSWARKDLAKFLFSGVH